MALALADKGLKAKFLVGGDMAADEKQKASNAFKVIYHKFIDEHNENDSQNPKTPKPQNPKTPD